MRGILFYLTKRTGSLLVGLFLAAFFAGLVGYPGTIQAQRQAVNTSLLEQSVVLTRDGQILIDGSTNNEAKLDILNNEYGFRYKVIDKPGYILDRLVIRLLLPENIPASAVNPSILAVHGVDDSTVRIIDQSTVEYTAMNVQGTATVTLVAHIPKTGLEVSGWRQLIVRSEALPIQVWLIIAASIPGLMILFGIIIYLLNFRDTFLRPQPLQTNQLPARLPPAMVGALITGTIGMREISATLIDLAQRGYIDIIYRDNGNFGFSRKRQWQNDKNLLEYERLLLDEIFSQDFLSYGEQIDKKLNKHVFNEAISKSIESVYAQMVALGYFRKDPRAAHAPIRFAGMIIFFLSVLGLLSSLLFVDRQPLIVVPWLVSIVTAPFLLRIAVAVPPRTEAGRVQAGQWLSFGRLLANGMTIKEAVAADLDLFERYLSYAVVLGVEGEWTANFAQVPYRVPDWFFSDQLFIDSYNAMAQALFSIIGFVGHRFSLSRQPNAV